MREPPELPRWVFDALPPSGQRRGGDPSEYAFTRTLDTFVREVRLAEPDPPAANTVYDNKIAVFRGPGMVVKTTPSTPPASCPASTRSSLAVRVEPQSIPRPWRTSGQREHSMGMCRPHAKRALRGPGAAAGPPARSGAPPRPATGDVRVPGPNQWMSIYSRSPQHHSAKYEPTVLRLLVALARSHRAVGVVMPRGHARLVAAEVVGADRPDPRRGMPRRRRPGRPGRT